MIYGAISNAISSAIGEMFWGIAKGLYNIIKMLGEAFEYLAGISPDKNNNTLLSSIWNEGKIESAYMFILLIAVGVMIVCMITGLIKAQYNKEQVGATKQVLTNTLKSTIYFVFFPIICMVFIYIVADLMNIIVNGTTSIFSDDSTTKTIGFTISQGIFNASLPQQAQGEGLEWTQSFSELVNKGAGLKAGGDFNYVLSIMVSGLIIWALLMATISLVERIINLILLYISAPIVIATSPLDQGARTNLLKDKLLSKYISIMGNILSMIIYLYLASWSQKEGNISFENKTVELFIKCVILIGGAFMCAKGNQLIAGLISHNEAMQEGLSAQQSNAMLHGGMALGGAILHGAGRKANAMAGGGLAGATGGSGSGEAGTNLAGGSGASATKGLGIGSKIKGGLSAVKNKGLIGAGGIVLGKTMGGIGHTINPLRFRRNNEEFKQHVGEKLLKGKSLSKHEDKRMDRLANKEGRANAQKEYEKKNLERGQSLLERRAGGVQAYRQYDLEEKGRKGSAL